MLMLLPINVVVGGGWPWPNTTTLMLKYFCATRSKYFWMSDVSGEIWQNGVTICHLPTQNCIIQRWTEELKKRVIFVFTGGGGGDQSMSWNSETYHLHSLIRRNRNLTIIQLIHHFPTLNLLATREKSIFLFRYWTEHNFAILDYFDKSQIYFPGLGNLDLQI